eukprot:7036645-Prorocentrum_lima.AAC.1
MYAQTPDSGGLSEVPVVSQSWFTSTTQTSRTSRMTTFMSGAQDHQDQQNQLLTVAHPTP